MTTAVAVPTKADALATLDFTGSPVVNTGMPTATRQSFPYVGFRGERMKSKVAECIAAGIETNEFFLGDAAGLQRVKPFDLHVMAWSWFSTSADSNGDITDISVDKLDDEKYKAGYRKHLLGLAAVVTGDTLTLATLAQRNATTQAFERAETLLRPGGAALDAVSWAKRSKDHAAGAALKWPCFRFRLRIWGETKAAAKGDCNVSYAQVLVTPPAAIPEIEKLMTTDLETRVRPIQGHYLSRVANWSRYAKLSEQEKATANIPW